MAKGRFYGKRGARRQVAETPVCGVPMALNSRRPVVRHMPRPRPRRLDGDPGSHIGFLDDVDRDQGEKKKRARKDDDLDLDRVW